MGAAGGECPGGRAFEAPHPKRLDGGSSQIQAAGEAMGEPHSGPLRVGGEQPVRTVLFLALVPQVGRV